MGGRVGVQVKHVWEVDNGVIDEITKRLPDGIQRNGLAKALR